MPHAHDSRLRRLASLFIQLEVLVALPVLAALAEVTHVPARLRAPPAWRADVIVVPSGDPDGHRTRAGSRALLEGRAPRMLITGTGHGEDSSHVLADLAASLGVPRDRIVLEDRSLNTWENMRFSRPFIEQLGARRALVMTSRVHARRASLLAEQSWPGVEVRVEPVEADDTNITGRGIEAAKTVRYGVLGRLPWGRVTGLW